MKRLAFLVLGLLWPNTAWAHSSLPGMMGLYWAMLHPFTVGPQILTLFALSLFIQQRLPESEDAFHGFWIGCALGAIAAAFGISGFDPEIPLSVLAVAGGILAASAIRLPAVILVIAGGLAGLLSGYISWPEPGATSDMTFTALGAVTGSILIVIVLTGAIEAVREKTGWPSFPIAVRVAGSWIAAIAALLGALLFRKMI